MLADLAASLRGPAMRAMTLLQEELWTAAEPQQQRITIQLVRNSVYFTLSCVMIGFFGDQLAV